MYVSYSPELDLSSCGKTVKEAKKNLLEAVGLFLEETKKMGTLNEILKEGGFVKEGQKRWKAPEWVSLERKVALIR